MKFLTLALLALALPVLAQAADCALSIDSNDRMQFSTSELTVPAGCETVELTLTHSGNLPKNIMGHNWVLVEEDQLRSVAAAAVAAGVANDYLPKDDERVLAATAMIGGGETTQIEFSVAELKGKNLRFFCSFPGHMALMQGQLIIE